jgi:hypothetical protein
MLCLKDKDSLANLDYEGSVHAHEAVNISSIGSPCGQFLGSKHLMHVAMTDFRIV